MLNNIIRLRIQLVEKKILWYIGSHSATNFTLSNRKMLSQSLDPPLTIIYSISRRQESTSNPRHSVSWHQLSGTLCLQFRKVSLPSPLSRHVWNLNCSLLHTTRSNISSVAGASDSNSRHTALLPTNVFDIWHLVNDAKTCLSSVSRSVTGICWGLHSRLSRLRWQLESLIIDRTQRTWGDNFSGSHETSSAAASDASNYTRKSCFQWVRIAKLSQKHCVGVLMTYSTKTTKYKCLSSYQVHFPSVNAFKRSFAHSVF